MWLLLPVPLHELHGDGRLQGEGSKLEGREGGGNWKNWESRRLWLTMPGRLQLNGLARLDAPRRWRRSFSKTSGHSSGSCCMWHAACGMLHEKVAGCTTRCTDTAAAAVHAAASCAADALRGSRGARGASCCCLGCCGCGSAGVAAEQCKCWWLSQIWKQLPARCPDWRLYNATRRHKLQAREREGEIERGRE